MEANRARADQRTDEALESSGFEDPRDLFRQRLRQLREQQPAAFAEAITYFEAELLPRVAAAGDPIEEWVQYGRRLGELTSPGRIVSVDVTGRGRPFRSMVEPGTMILHIPHDTAVDVLPLAMPRTPSAAQRATYDLLVNRARSLAG